jgi:hypothetical protein
LIIAPNTKTMISGANITIHFNGDPKIAFTIAGLVPTAQAAAAVITSATDIRP